MLNSVNFILSDFFTSRNIKFNFTFVLNIFSRKKEGILQIDIKTSLIGNEQLKSLQQKLINNDCHICHERSSQFFAL